MLIIKNAKISTGAENETRKVSIIIEGEKISAIEDSSFPVPKGVEIIDAKGNLVLPGAIDPHVHFNTPGYEQHEDFAHGSRAAAAGGVTTVIDMPDTSVPPVTSRLALETKLAAIKEEACVDYALWGGVSANSMREEWWHDSMVELWEDGVVGFKTYLISSMSTFRELSLMQLGQVMQHAKKIGAVVGLHAEERDMITSKTDELQRAGKNSLFDYYFSRSDPAEKQGIAIGIHLAKYTGARLHIVHLSSSSGAGLIRRAKLMEMDISAETCPHYLQFTYKDFDKYGALIKTAPVVKTESDRAGLWEALKDNTIDFLATDHAPSSVEEKKTGSAWTDYNGIPGVQLLLPYIFSEGYSSGRITLARLIEITSKGAAKRFGIYPQKGAIQKGSDADLVFIDESKQWKISGKDLLSKGKWSPLEGMVLKGKIVKTMLRGKFVYEAGRVTAKKGYGKFLKRIEKEI